jgi:hypothetical protein
MSKYRKKPVVIEAFKWMGDHTSMENPPAWLLTAIKDGTIMFTQLHDVFGDQMLIETLEGTHRASPGDFIIQGVKGELYPCKPDIFEATYELVEEDNHAK